MLAIPLIRTDDDSTMTTIERTTLTLDSVITAMMMHATINDPASTEQDIETYITLSVAIVTPAEA